MSINADVVVVGGGVIGTAITYYLARNGVNTCLVEKNDIASGTSSACGHTVSLQTKTLGPKLKLTQQSIVLFHNLEDELESDIEWSNEGSIVVAETEAEEEFLKMKVNSLQAAGIQLEYLNGTAARLFQPALAQHINAVSYCPEDSTVNSIKLSMAYTQAAKRLGAIIQTFTEVVGIEAQGDRISSVITNREKIQTDIVVNAAGIWSPILARMMNYNLPIKPRKGELFVTERIPPLWQGVLISAGYLMSKSQADIVLSPNEIQAGIAGGMTRSGNFLIGSTREDAGYNNHSTYAGIQILMRLITRLVPGFRNVHVLRFYSGLRPSTPDGLPIIGRSPFLPGFYVAAGHEGDGVALSPVTGKIIAELITGKISEDKLTPFAWTRFMG